MNNPTEQTALLYTPRPPATPLPRFQVFILLMMRITEPISYTVIFPFINQMMEEVAHIPNAKVGYYAGLVESAFALVQFLFVYQWGALSDRVGRRVVALTGLGGVLISVLGFGLSKNLGMMIVTRCIAGAMNGNVAVVKSMLAEITDETNQARAFALLPAAYAVGSTIGPLLGGYLSHPVERYPVFERMGFVTVFLSDYPFFLPCFVGSLCNLSAIIFGYFYLQETLTHKPKSKNSEPSSSSPSPPSLKPRPLLNPLSSLLKITRVLTTWFFLAVLNSSYQALIPLFCYSSYPSGGVNFSPSQIGLLLSINGVTALISQTLIFPELEVRLGPAKTYQLVITFLPIVFTCLPLAHWVYPLGSKMVWVVLGGMVAAKTISNMGAVCNNLLINNSAPSRESLGSLNGINQSTSSLARSFGPAGTTTLFALSNEHHLLGGQLVHIVLAGVSDFSLLSAIESSLGRLNIIISYDSTYNWEKLIFLKQIALVTWSLTMRLENVQPAWRKPPSSPSRRDLGSGTASSSVSTSP
ncbi:MFS general substrate transporter [Dendrothele bispora CBS 962.96]|uniref:MFS general substrate transporter n=1 Tax=Dendrothele bispora (strain CBS 962.96) TaxID=1314807 RepID=A0A4S8LGU1_DENBC|nr:MFS general substrate transporter [Dendrothele bispora CBS 962.96]